MVLFRRVRSVLIRAHGEGLIAHTLNFDYEVRPAEEAFSELPVPKADDEMLDLALHIIKKRRPANSIPRRSTTGTTRRCSSW
jgi:DNA end-binding protein Ku